MLTYIRTLLYCCTFFALTCLGAVSPVLAATQQQNNLSSADNYQIGPGDVLQITVWKEDGMDLQILVRPDGGITFPLAGDIHAGGKTVQQLTDVLTTRLKRYMPNAVVTVTVVKAASNTIYVVGKVNRPGPFNAVRYVDVLQALALAGGLTPYADADDIKIIRQSNGKQEVFNFDYDEVISGERLDMNIRLKAGDTIAVP